METVSIYYYGMTVCCVLFHADYFLVLLGSRKWPPNPAWQRRRGQPGWAGRMGCLLRMVKNGKEADGRTEAPAPSRTQKVEFSVTKKPGCIMVHLHVRTWPQKFPRCLGVPGRVRAPAIWSMNRKRCQASSRLPRMLRQLDGTAMMLS